MRYEREPVPTLTAWESAALFLPDHTPDNPRKESRYERLFPSVRLRFESVSYLLNSESPPIDGRLPTVTAAGHH